MSDSAIPILLGLTNLRILGLTGTDVTDASVSALKTFPHLEYLFIGRTRITESGALQLRTALRKTKIVYYPR